MTDALVLVLCLFVVVILPLAVELGTVTRRLRIANERVKILLEHNARIERWYNHVRRENTDRILWMRNAITWINLMEPSNLAEEEIEAVNAMLQMDGRR